MNDDSHPRLDYFDFDDVENRRKKPKTEYRKRPTGNGTASTPAPKKPRGRTPKAANGERNVTKKPKAVKTVKKTAMSKPAVVISGTSTTAQDSGVPAVRPTGSIPIAPLRAAHPTIPSGILQGVPLSSVSVPISAVGVPLTGVPVSRVSIPGVRLSGVNIPVSGVNVPVSAVIKQGSLGGRSFVFTGAVTGSSTPGVSTSGITTMGASGNTHHLKIVVNPSTDGGIKFTAPPKSSEAQSTLQYKTAIVTAPHPSKTSAPVKVTAANSTEQTLVTAKPITSAVVTSSARTSPPTTLPTTTVTVSQAALTTSSKPVVVSRSVVTVPKSAVVSGQAQFPVQQGQLSAGSSKQTNVPPSAPGKPLLTTQPPKAIPQGTRVSTAASTKPQTTMSSTASKPTTVRVTHAGPTQSSMNLARKSPSPQSATRTIQVGVKRTVTYNPSTQSKNVTVVSRPLPSEGLTTHINLERLKARLKTIQNLTGGQIGAAQMKTLQSLTQPGSATVQSKPRNVAQSSTGPLQGSSAQSASKVTTSHSSTSTVTSSVNPKPSSIAVTTPTTRTSTKSMTQTVTLTTSGITTKSTAQPVQSATQVSSSARSASVSAEKPSTKSLQKPSTQSVQITAQATAKPEQSAKPSAPQVTVKSNVMSIGKSSSQSISKPATHFIQVPASAKSSAQNLTKTSAQTPTTQNIQSTTTQVSVQSTLSSSTAKRAPSTVVSSLTSSSSEKEEPTGAGRITKVADDQSDQSDSSCTLGAISDEEKFAEKINSIVKEVVGGKQRTTRQSVRRLVAAAKLAEAQHKRGESDEDGKEQKKT